MQATNAIKSSAQMIKRAVVIVFIFYKVNNLFQFIFKKVLIVP